MLIDPLLSNLTLNLHPQQSAFVAHTIHGLAKELAQGSQLTNRELTTVLLGVIMLGLSELGRIKTQYGMEEVRGSLLKVLQRLNTLSPPIEGVA